MASIAPSAAPADTPRVNGVASGLRSSAWRTTPGRRQRGADQRRGEHARQPRHEEDLRVDVVGPRHRPVERAPQADRRAADSGAATRHERATPPKSSTRRQQPPARPPSSIAAAMPAASSGTTSSWPPRCVHDLGLDVVERAHVAGVSTSAVRPAASTRPSAAAPASRQIPRREREVVRRDHDRDAALGVELERAVPRSRAGAEVERRGRLVEQQHALAWLELRQRAGDDHPLLLAAAERR